MKRIFQSETPNLVKNVLSENFRHVQPAHGYTPQTSFPLHKTGRCPISIFPATDTALLSKANEWFFSNTTAVIIQLTLKLISSERVVVIIKVHCTNVLINSVVNKLYGCDRKPHCSSTRNIQVPCRLLNFTSLH